MLRALNLLFFPDKEWEKMALNPPHVLTTLFVSLASLMAVAYSIEGWGLMQWGELAGNLGRLRIPSERIIKYEVFHAVASLLIILAGAWLLLSIGQSFNLMAPYSSCFTLMAFAYSPIFLLRIPDAMPLVNTWICWAIGAALSFRILYHGIAHWLKPEQTKGFGLLLISLIYTIVLSGFVHFASVQVLHGKLLRHVFPDKPAGLAVPQK